MDQLLSQRSHRHAESGHDRRPHADNTNYNVLDNHSGAEELWLRGGFEWDITNDVTLRSQVYGYGAKRHWFNNEVKAFNDIRRPNKVYRERSFVEHDQRLYGNITDLTVNANIAGMDNRLVDDVCGEQPAIQRRRRNDFFIRLRSIWSIRIAASTACARQERSDRTSTMNRCRSRTG